MIEAIHRLALDTLKNHVTAAGGDAREDDGDLIIGQHRLGLSITFDGFAQQGEQRIAPLEVQIHLDGDTGDRFRVGTLGVGPTDDAAIHSAIEEWHVLAAAPLLAALGAAAGRRVREATLPKFGSWDVFPGRAGFRGSVPAEFHPSGSFYQQMLDVLRQFVASWKPKAKLDFRSIFVMAGAGENQREVQAAVDGFVDNELGEQLKQLPWPEAPEAFFYKQLFVLRYRE